MTCPFCSGRLSEKYNINVCGLSTQFSVNLAELGYTQAYVLLGQYLLFRKEDLYFIEWLKEKGKISNEDALRCCNCISEWCRIHL
jgi:hypothetical protein